MLVAAAVASVEALADFTMSVVVDEEVQATRREESSGGIVGVDSVGSSAKPDGTRGSEEEGMMRRDGGGGDRRRERRGRERDRVQK